MVDQMIGIAGPRSNHGRAGHYLSAKKGSNKSRIISIGFYL